MADRAHLGVVPLLDAAGWDIVLARILVVGGRSRDIRNAVHIGSVVYIGATIGVGTDIHIRVGTNIGIHVGARIRIILTRPIERGKSAIRNRVQRIYSGIVGGPIGIVGGPIGIVRGLIGVHSI